MDVPTIYSDFIILKRSHSNPKDSDIFTVGKSNLNPIDFYNKVLNLDIPPRVKDLNMSADERARAAAETICAFNDLPFAVLAFGKSKDTQEEAVLLGFVSGVTPENALQEFKQRIQRRKAAFN
ncbi:MAG: hypothetical protein Q8P26_02225 [Candidatus Levybacteria bacterium]|nr:hypothetical protein [Candidatus Levybacteria bacterium]